MKRSVRTVCFTALISALAVAVYTSSMPVSADSSLHYEETFEFTYDQDEAPGYYHLYIDGASITSVDYDLSDRKIYIKGYVPDISDFAVHSVISASDCNYLGRVYVRYRDENDYEELWDHLYGNEDDTNVAFFVDQQKPDGFTYSQDRTIKNLPDIEGATRLDLTDNNIAIPNFHIELTLDGSEADVVEYTGPTRISVDADDKGGETGFKIPWGAIGAVGLIIPAGGVIAGIVIAQNKKKKAKQKKKAQEEEQAECSYAMRVYKDFGDTFTGGDTHPVYARIVKVSPENGEVTVPEMTQQINIYTRGFLTVGSKNMAGQYMGAMISAPYTDQHNINATPSNAVVVFDFRGLFKVEMRFKIRGCMIVTDPATGAQRMFTVNPKTGQWESDDGTVLDTEGITDWEKQREQDRVFLDDQMKKLSERNTAVDREIVELEEKGRIEQAMLDEEAKKIQRNLRKYGIASADDKEVIERIRKQQEIDNMWSNHYNRSGNYFSFMENTANVVQWAADLGVDICDVASFGTLRGVKCTYIVYRNTAGDLVDAIINKKDIPSALRKTIGKSIVDVTQANVSKIGFKYAAYGLGDGYKNMMDAIDEGQDPVVAFTKGLVGGTLKAGLEHGLSTGLKDKFTKAPEILKKTARRSNEIMELNAKGQLSEKTAQALRQFVRQKGIQDAHLAGQVEDQIIDYIGIGTGQTVDLGMKLFN